MYSDLSSDVRVLNILNTEGKNYIGLGTCGCLGYFFFLREIANSAGQNLGQPSSPIPLMIIINIKNGGFYGEFST